MLRRGHQAGDDQLPHAQARERRPLLRAHLRSDQGLGVLLRQVQARPLQGHRLRALRRRGDALEGAPRAHGPHRPRRAGQPHLVLQGRAEPHRLPARHGPARSSRRSSTSPPRSSPGSTTRRARATSTSSRRRSTRSSTPTPPSARSACSELRESLDAPRGVPRDRQADRLRRRGPPLGGLAATSRSRSCTAEDRDKHAQGAAQDLRGRHRRHRGLHRGRRRAHASGVGALPDDGAEADRQRRDALPRAQGPLRLAATASATTSAAAWARRRSATCSSRSTSRPSAIELREHDPHRQGPEAGRARSSG